MLKCTHQGAFQIVGILNSPSRFPRLALVQDHLVGSQSNLCKQVCYCCLFTSLKSINGWLPTSATPLHTIPVATEPEGSTSIFTTPENSSQYGHWSPWFLSLSLLWSFANRLSNRSSPLSRLILSKCLHSLLFNARSNFSNSSLDSSIYESLLLLKLNTAIDEFPWYNLIFGGGSSPKGIPSESSCLVELTRIV